MAATREDRFPSMGSAAHVVVVGGPPGTILRARRRLADLEARWSRFRPESEVGLLNAAAGSLVPVSPPTRLLLERAIEGRALTGGRFDPTMLHDLEQLGYDRSFELLADAGPPTTPAPDRGERSEHAPDDWVVLGDDGRSACLAPGIGFDPGGIGKGLAADLVVAELLEAGAEGASVNVGGDVRVEGTAPTDDGWIVAVEDPWRPAMELTRFALRAGAAATSNCRMRTWVHDGIEEHHLLDPTTGEGLRSGLAAVTVVSGEGWLSEVLTKAALVAGHREAGEVVRRAGVAAVLVADDGAVEMIGIPTTGEPVAASRSAGWRVA